MVEELSNICLKKGKSKVYHHDINILLSSCSVKRVDRGGGEFHISHDASRLISVFSPRWKERSRVSREILNDLNFKMQLIQGKFQ